jgi:hypothetical protein
MDKIVIDNKIYRFEQEYENCEDIGRRVQLKAIVDKLHGKSQNNIEKFNQILNNLQNEQSKKPYHRLNAFQKEQIIKSYVNETWGAAKIDKYSKQIMKFIESKDIATSNVTYDVENGLLKNIKNIEEVDDNIVIKAKAKVTKKIIAKKETVKEELKEEEVKEVVKEVKTVTKPKVTKKVSKK